MIQKLLIANRGEIVLRIARSCREMGIATVGVYSEADAHSAHVRGVDEAYCIGAAAPSASYLCMDKLLDVARRSGADAIHPGYGFLSENAGFARAVQEAGLIWVGPPADVIDLMGDKIRSRKTAMDLNVPVIPGTEGEVSDLDEMIARARSIGFPVLLKASGGGGGKGIRLVHDQSRLEKELRLAQNEARKAFGNAAVFMEKAILNGRHIEVQLLALNSNKALHLGERECSLQRRHQKLVEECPSPVITADLRKRLTDAAIALSEGIGYRNAGTVEFLVDQDNEIYFLEMNTRLQVEHAVTEMVTGLDIVRYQLMIASGQDPELTQDDVEFRGHAVEYRVYAEDPEANFAPSFGRIEHLDSPQGPFVRLDSHIWEGDEVSLHYDPMLAKLVVWAEDRPRALARLKRAAEDYVILGPKTSLSLIPKLCANAEFQSGQFHTKWLEAFLKDSSKDPRPPLAAVIAAALHAHTQSAAPGPSPQASSGMSPWVLRGRPH